MCFKCQDQDLLVLFGNFHFQFTKNNDLKIEDFLIIIQLTQQCDTNQGE